MRKDRIYWKTIQPEINSKENRKNNIKILQDSLKIHYGLFRLGFYTQIFYFLEILDGST